MSLYAFELIGPLGKTTYLVASRSVESAYGSVCGYLEDNCLYVPAFESFRVLLIDEGQVLHFRPEAIHESD